MDERQLLELIKNRFPQTGEFVSLGQIEQLRESSPSLYNTIQRYIVIVSEQPPSPTQQTQEPPPQPPSIPSAELLGLALAPFVKFQPELMELDGAYGKIAQDKLKEWQKNNPDLKGKKAELDYIYGSLDSPDAPSLKKDAEAAFRQRYANKKNWLGRIDKRLKRYEKNKNKIYKNKKGVFRLGDDPAIKRYTQSIQEEANRRYDLLKKTDNNVQFHDVFRTVNEARWQQFASEYKEKAEAYSSADTNQINKSADERSYSEWIKNGRNSHLQRMPYAQPAAQSHPPHGLIEKLPDMRPEIERRMKAQLQQTQWPKQPTTPLPSSAYPAHTVQTQPPRGVQNIRSRFLNYATRGRYKRARQAFSRWAGRGVGKTTTKTIGGINRFVNAVNIAQHPEEAAKSYAENKAIGFAGRQTARLGGAAARIGGRLAAQAAAGIGSSLAGALGGLGGVGVGPIAAVVGGILLLIFLVVIIVVIIIVLFFGQNNTANIIPGLVIKKTGPPSIQYTTNTNITYTITVSYTGPLAIVVDDPIPSNTSFVGATGEHRYENNIVSWQLRNNQSTAPPEGGINTYVFTLTVHPQRDDVEIKNTATARSVGNLPIPLPLPGQSGNLCTLRYEGTGYCSVENLKQYFGNNAIIASMICQAESGSDPFALNTNCGTNDYSVGLFQVNLVAHCAGAYAGLSCQTPFDLNKRSECEHKFKNPEENIRYAAQLSNNGASWTSWGTWSHGSSGNPSVRDIASRCGI